MTLQDLINQLQELADEFGPDTEVRLAQQPAWAFEYSVGDVAACTSDPDDEDGEEPDAPVVYISEGQQLGYLPGAAANTLGWGRR